MRDVSTSLHERFAMVLRFTLSITLLILGLPNEATLKAETPAQACKSTVTGMLEMIPLESKVYGNKRLLRVWLPPGYSEPVAAAKRYPVTLSWFRPHATHLETAGMCNDRKASAHQRGRARDTASPPQLAQNSLAAATRAGGVCCQTPYSQAE